MRLKLCYDFFFFKQKTAYEMRISDWSSDVCSSDLFRPAEGRSCAEQHGRIGAGVEFQAAQIGERILARHQRVGGRVDPVIGAGQQEAERRAPAEDGKGGAFRFGQPMRFPIAGAERSEEHTSELQSLMRHSYAVFCLQKKKHTTTN